MQNFLISDIFDIEKEVALVDCPKLLIADSSDEFRESLTQALQNACNVRTCRSGAQALELLHNFRPDIMVMDLMLAELDGLTLLQMAIQSGIRPRVLVTANYFSPYVRSVLNRLEVDYCMQKPCSLQAIVCRVNDFVAETAPVAPAEANETDVVASMLLHLGFGAHLDGFRYLCKAIPLFRMDMGQAITKELYVTVGEIYNKDPRQVERSIRSAIESAYKRRSDAQWAQYFTTCPGGYVPKLSNGKFIAHLAQRLNHQTADKTCA